MDDDDSVIVCPHCGKKIESQAPKPPPVDTVALKKRMKGDEAEGAAAVKNSKFWLDLESSTKLGTDSNRAARRQTDDAQTSLNIAAAKYRARSDTLAAARGRK